MKIKASIVVALLALLATYLVVRVPVACRGCAPFHWHSEHFAVWRWKIEKTRSWPPHWPNGMWHVGVPVRDAQRGDLGVMTLGQHEAMDCAILQAAIGAIPSDQPWF